MILFLESSVCSYQEHGSSATSALPIETSNGRRQSVDSHHAGSEKECNVDLKVAVFCKTSGDVLCYMWTDNTKLKELKKGKFKQYQCKTEAKIELATKHRDEITITLDKGGCCVENNIGIIPIVRHILVSDVTRYKSFINYFHLHRGNHGEKAYADLHVNVGGARSQTIPICLECSSNDDIQDAIKLLKKLTRGGKNLSISELSVSSI